MGIETYELVGDYRDWSRNGREFGACENGIREASRYKTIQEWWSFSKRADWMLWGLMAIFLQKAGYVRPTGGMKDDVVVKLEEELLKTEEYLIHSAGPTYSHHQTTIRRWALAADALREMIKDPTQVKVKDYFYHGSRTRKRTGCGVRVYELRNSRWRRVRGKAVFDE